MESSKKYTVFVGKKAEKFLNTLPEPYFSAITIGWCFKKYDTTLDIPIIDIKES